MESGRSAPDRGVPSTHAVDLLIRELLQSGRAASDVEIERIVQRMATVPFSGAIIRVPVDERGTSYAGYTLGGRAPSLAYHLAKRVAVEHQWTFGTTADEYVDSLRQAVRHVDSRLVVYVRRGGSLAATLTPTERVQSVEQRGSRSLTYLLVVYSADRGMLISGYQCSELEHTGIPREGRWLK